MPRAFCASAMAEAVVHHELVVKIEPQDSYLASQDRIRLPEPMAADESELTFTLNATMGPVVIDPPARQIVNDRRAPVHPSLTRYTMKLPKAAAGVTLRYQGRLAQRLADIEDSSAPEIPFEAGHIGARGVYLSAASHWYPRIDITLVSFSLEVDLPTGWVAVSQGKRGVHEGHAGRPMGRWDEQQPQDDI